MAKISLCYFNRKDSRWEPINEDLLYSDDAINEAGAAYAISCCFERPPNSGPIPPNGYSPIAIRAAIKAYFNHIEKDNDD
jgi:hypothetical protein